MSEPTRQTSIQPFDEMNRYDGRDRRTEDGYPINSDEVYAPPRRTVANGWAKFHAVRDCGEQNVRYVEHTSWHTTSERHEYRLYCFSCRYEVDESDVLFIGGDWWNENGWRTYGRPVDDLFIPPERVLDLGPDPDEDELKDVLNIGRIERESGSLWHPFHTDRFEPCDECGNEVPIQFDGKCRMCYDGPWTDRLQKDVEIQANRVREWVNSSYKHKLEQHVDPLFVGGKPGEGEVLWRRHDMEGTTKLVIVTKRLEDMDDGHREYELWDPTYTEKWQYREEDLADLFWSTGLYDRHSEGVGNEEIREAYQWVCDHIYREVHTENEDGELVPDGEQCIHCRKRRDSSKRAYSEDP